MKKHNLRDSSGRFASVKAISKRKPVTKKKSTPKSKTIINAFLMDSSGSMSGKENSTISGFNEILDNSIKDDATFKTKSINLIAFFGSDYKFYPNEVKNLVNGSSGVQYANKVGYASDMGMTALWESANKIITATEEKLKTNPGAKVIVTLFTDGDENASSQEWRDGKKIKEIIQQKQKEGWVINFIGAGDQTQVQAVADSVGIFSANTVNYANSAAGTRGIMSKMSSANTSYKSKVSKGTDTNIGFFAD